MTLVTLATAALPVVLLFLASAWLQGGGRLDRASGLAATLEALTVTAVAALWFGSLGSGGWVTLFLLLALLAGGAERGTRAAFLRSGRAAEVRGLVLALARYLAAGALLAWRLG